MTQPPLPRIAGIPAWCVGLAVAGAAGAAVVVRGRQDVPGCGLLLVMLLGLFLALGSWRNRYLTVAMLAATWAFAAVSLAASGYELNSWLKWQRNLSREPEELARLLAGIDRIAQRCRDCPPTGQGRDFDPVALAAEMRTDSEKLIASARANVLRHRRGFFWTLPLSAAFLASAAFLKRWHRTQAELESAGPATPP